MAEFVLPDAMVEAAAVALRRHYDSEHDASGLPWSQWVPDAVEVLTAALDGCEVKERFLVYRGYDPQTGLWESCSDDYDDLGDVLRCRQRWLDLATTTGFPLPDLTITRELVITTPAEVVPDAG